MRISFAEGNFTFPLEDVDGRTALCLMIGLTKKEREGGGLFRHVEDCLSSSFEERFTNIQRPRWIKADGTEDPRLGCPAVCPFHAFFHAFFDAFRCFVS